jgi:CheY-like chemotaxis protein
MWRGRKRPFLLEGQKIKGNGRFVGQGKRLWRTAVFLSNYRFSVLAVGNDGNGRIVDKLCREVANGMEVVEMATVSQPDMVLMDLRMP